MNYNDAEKFDLNASANHIFMKSNGIGAEMGKPNWYVRNVAKRKHCLLTMISPRKTIIRRINMNPEETRDILFDMRDQHLQFIDGVENTGTWGEKFLKEAWACDLGAKALEKQIPCKPEEYVPDFPYNIFSTQKCAKCGTPVIGKKISKYCSECGQKIDWGEA